MKMYMAEQILTLNYKELQSETVLLTIELITKEGKIYMLKHRTQNRIIEDVTEEYLANIDRIEPPTPETIEQELINIINTNIKNENDTRAKGEPRLPFITTLTHAQIADIMIALHQVIKVPANNLNPDPDDDLVLIYNYEGRKKGIYTASYNTFRHIALQYNYTMSNRFFDEVYMHLRNKAPRRRKTMDQDLIAVNNGIFNYVTKELHPFSPDYVFTSKSKVNYNPDAKNINIYNEEDGTDWNVEEWVESLSDDPEIVQLIWEILGAIIRPHVSWNKSAWLYSTKGNNGKGTLCALMRNLCGEGSYASIAINDFGKNFMLQPLINASAIIVDENDVGAYIDRAANLKAISTNDVILIDIKHKDPIPFQFHGFMVQCLNGFPKVKDTSGSFYRRQLFIPMEKSFTGIERKYIKDDYLNRPEVLEYVMYKILNMDYYNLSEPARCVDILNEYKEFNNPVQEFFNELKEEFVWDLLPFTFLFDLYKSWYAKTFPSGKPLGRNTFIEDLLQVIEHDDEWICRGKNNKVRTGDLMDEPELLIAKYELKDWYNPHYRSNDPEQISKPKLAQAYRGIERL